MTQDYIINERVTSIKIPIKVDDYLRDFIFKNINMRRQIWNDFVEAYYKEYNEDYHDSNFKPLKFLTAYKVMEMNIRRYDTYCVGLSEQVAKDMIYSMKSNRTKNTKVYNKETTNSFSKLHFQKRDNYHGSFKVHCKYDKKTDNHRIRKIYDDTHIQFRARGSKYNRPKEYLDIELLESLYDDLFVNDDGKVVYIRYYKEDQDKRAHQCRFMKKDIKEIAFIHELGKFYIQLSVNVSYWINKNEIDSRPLDKAGIDTGIHNPLMIYDGYKFISIRMDEKRSNKIHYLERRAKRIQHHMSKKFKYNKDHNLNPYSNNYKKLKNKFRKIWKKITNILRDWQYKTIKKIVTTYKMIVVDKFKQPENKYKEIQSKVKRQFNYDNRFHAMFTFNERLYDMSIKYGCIYIEAPEDTTRTCSICGHVNDHLPLSKRYITCDKCGSIIDRDENAAKNCYAYA